MLPPNLEVRQRRLIFQHTGLQVLWPSAGSHITAVGFSFPILKLAH